MGHQHSESRYLPAPRIPIQVFAANVLIQVICINLMQEICINLMQVICINLIQVICINLIQVILYYFDTSNLYL